MSMLRADCLAVLAEHHTDELVVCTLGQTSAEWWAVNPHRDEDTFYSRSSMGLVSSMALGLAMALPHRPVWALDSDGSLLMNLSTLLTTAAVGPTNLLHVVWFNGSYEATGKQPLAIAPEADVAAMARAAGIAEVHHVRELEDFRALAPQVVRPRRHTFVLAEVEQLPHKGGNASPRFPADMAYRFGRHVEETEGIEVFGG